MGLAMDALMGVLGYKRYGIVTTDLGWQMGMWMVQDVGRNIVGHMTDFFIPPPRPADSEQLKDNRRKTAQEAEYILSLQAYMTKHAAYASVQSQRPLALAAAMADSPVGYAAWIWHLMHAVSDGYAYSHDDLITATMMLWIQGPYGNLRTYKEFYKVRKGEPPFASGSVCHVACLTRSSLTPSNLHSPVSWTSQGHRFQLVCPSGSAPMGRILS
jgi:hypothetical protein